MMVGEIGVLQKRKQRSLLRKMTKPVVAYLAGKSAPPGKRMGHAGAIIERGKGTFEGKVKALEAAGVPVAALPFEIVSLIKDKI